MARWNIDVPSSEYFGPLPANPRGVVSGDIGALIRELEDTPKIAADSETTGLNHYKDHVLYWSLAWGKRRCTLHSSVLPYFAHIFKDPRKTWIGASFKFDMHMFAQMGYFFAGKCWDTKVKHCLLFEEESHALKDMAKNLLGWRWSDFQNTFGKIRADFGPLDLIRKAEQDDFPLLVEYAANDAWGTLGVSEDLEKRLKQAQTHSLFREIPPYIETLWDLFSKVEAPYTKVLWKNERYGIGIDRQKIAEIEPRARREIEDMERELTRIAGWMMNPDSAAHLRFYFFDQMKMAPRRMTSGGKTGNRLPSTDSDFIDWASQEGDPVARVLTRLRKLKKLYGTYIMGIPKYIDTNSRLHTTFNQDTARTGRLSSSDPNVQTVPQPEHDKWNLRSLFVARPGHNLIVADYNQLEMRLLAAAALEQDMINIFLKGWDIHMGNAEIMYGIPYDEIKQAKKIDKEVQEGKLPASALTQRVVECLTRRGEAKNIGFGQRKSGRTKTLSKRGTLKATAHGNPVLPVVPGSVSTCGRRPTQFAAAV